MSEIEIWRAVVGYEGRYEVSNLGRVRSLERFEYRRATRRTAPYERWCPTKVMALTGKPYLSVGLGNPSVRRTIHSLVAEAFIGPRPAGMDVCHWDGLRKNNRAENIIYDTHIENEKHKIRHGTKLPSEKHPKAKLTREQVREIRLLAPHDDYPTLASHYGVDQSLIGYIATGKIWKDGPCGTPRWKLEMGGAL